MGQANTKSPHRLLHPPGRQLASSQHRDGRRGREEGALHFRTLGSLARVECFFGPEEAEPLRDYGGHSFLR